MGISFYHYFYNFMVSNLRKGPGKRGHIVADTNVSPLAHARNICCGHKSCAGHKKCRPGSDAVLHMSRIEFIELSSCEVRRLNQFETAHIIRIGSAVLHAWLSRE